MTLDEGLHDIPAEVYHADPAHEPSLSASVAFLMLERTARHAQLAHPRLNPGFVPPTSEVMDVGSAAHALMLHDERAFAVIDHPDFRTNDAKQRRDEAHARGAIPILSHRLDQVRAMVAAGRAQLVHHADARGAFQAGRPEQSLFWRERVDGADVWCRARPDWVYDTGELLDDYKTTTASAAPGEWGKRALFDHGNDVRAAFYLRGARKVLGWKTGEYRFVVQEVEPPSALAVIALTPLALAQADQKVAEALSYWAWCMKRGWWPGFPRHTAYVDPPAWREIDWEARRTQARYLADTTPDRFELAIEWQAPFSPKVTV